MAKKSKRIDWNAIAKMDGEYLTKEFNSNAELREEFNDNITSFYNFVLQNYPDSPTHREEGETNYVKDTPQNLAVGFTNLARSIEKTLNTYVYRQQEPEFSASFRIHRSSAKILWKHAKGIGITLPAVHTLSGDNDHAVLSRLLEWCESAAGILTGETKDESKHLITLAVAVKNFTVSRSTLNRAIDDGRLIQYGTKAMGQIDLKKVASLWPQRK